MGWSCTQKKLRINSQREYEDEVEELDNGGLNVMETTGSMGNINKKRE